MPCKHARISYDSVIQIVCSCNTKTTFDYAIRIALISNDDGVN